MDIQKQLDNQKLVEDAYLVWKDSLSHFPEDNAQEIALLLENQKLFHIQKPDGNDISMQLIPKVFEYFVGFDLVQVQTMSRPGDKVCFIEDSVMTDSEINAVTRNSKVVYKDDLDTFARGIGQEMSREIINDLYNNVGTVASKEIISNKEIYLAVVQLRDIIHTKTKQIRDGWLVTNQRIAEILLYQQFEKIDLIKNVGLINGEIKVIVDPLFGEDILIGQNGDHLDGYFYCPYILYAKQENGHVMRYAKRLVNNKHYAKLKFVN